MKIGNSPIYYLNNQKEQLEKFTNYLNDKDKKAFYKLKEEKILWDAEQEPLMRVSLRKLKDFAIPINAIINNQEKILWKYFLIPENEIQRILKEKQNKVTQKIEIDKKTNSPTNKPTEAKPNTLPKKFEPIELKNKKEEIALESKVKKHLDKKNIEIIKDISVKKREFIAKIKTDTLFGKQEFLLISKDKKKISADDLTIAIQKAQIEKMPALFISPGELDKNAQIYIEEWRNLIKFEKI